MAHLEIQKLIPASAEAVWSVLEDLEHQGDWMADVRALAVVSDQKRGIGAVLRVTSTVFGLPIVKDEMEVTGWEPGRRMDVVHRTPTASFGSIALRGTGSFILETADSGTKLRWIEDFELPLGRLGDMGFAAVVRPHLLRVFGRSLANVRRLAVEREGTSETAVSVPPPD